MPLVLSHMSAFEFWRLHEFDRSSCRGQTLSRHTHSNPPADFSDDSLSRFLDGLTDPVHVLVPDSSDARRQDHFLYHTCRASLPYGSFAKIDKNAFVSCPELCFLHLAKTRSFVELIALAYELCGTYAISTTDPRGFVDRSSLTSIAQLESFIERAGSLYGVGRARQSLRHILPGAASPRETAMAILLCLPNSLGGYALPKPFLNHRIVANWHTQKVTRQQEFFCDAYWPTEKVAVEYDSDQYHSGSEKIAHDSIRRNILADMGITTITITRRQINSRFELDKVARILAKRLGKRIQPRCEDYLAKQQTLRSAIL